MPADEQFLKRWRRRRLAYNAGLGALFVAVASYVGPNLILFGQPTWITPAWFVPVVERACVPVVRAMKEYQRDHGRLPARGEELMPDYYPPDGPFRGQVEAFVQDGKFEWWAMYNHMITYDFTPASEGWSVRGVYTEGPIPVPPVKIDPTTRPATGPANEAATAPADLPR